MKTNKEPPKFPKTNNPLKVTLSPQEKQAACLLLLVFLFRAEVVFIMALLLGLAAAIWLMWEEDEKIDISLMKEAVLLIWKQGWILFVFSAICVLRRPWLLAAAFFVFAASVLMHHVGLTTRIKENCD